jgi:hypothetical protein
MRIQLIAVATALALLPVTSWANEPETHTNPRLPHRPVRTDFHPQLPPCSLLIEELKDLPPLELAVTVLDTETGRQPLLERLIKDAVWRMCDSAGIPIRKKGYWFQPRAFLVIECLYAFEPPADEKWGVATDLGFLYIFCEVLRAYPTYTNPWQYVHQRAWCTQKHGPIPSLYMLDVMLDYVLDQTRQLARFHRDARALEGLVPLVHKADLPGPRDSATARREGSNEGDFE